MTTRTRVLAGAMLAFVVSAAARPAEAQPSPEAEAMPRVEFEDAIQRALAENPTVSAAAAAVRQAEAFLAQARAANRPWVSAAASSSRLDQGVEFSGLVAQPQTQTTVSLTASVPVLDAPGWAAVTHDRDRVEVSRLSLAEARQGVAVAAAGAYLAVITARRQVDIERRALDNARAYLDYARKRLAEGAGSRLDELRAAQLVSTAEARLENRALALRDSQEALGVVLAANGPVDAGAVPALAEPAPVDEASQLDARPDVRRQTAAIRATDRVVQDSWKDWLPTGALGFTPQWLTPAGVFQESGSWRLVLSLSQPIFDGGQRKAARALRAVALDQAKLELTAVEIEARSQIRVARESLASYERALASARRAAIQAGEILEITTAAFRLGATTSLEVIDAERSARDAATAAALVEDSVRRARLDLLAGLGLFPRPDAEGDPAARE